MVCAGSRAWKRTKCIKKLKNNVIIFFKILEFLYLDHKGTMKSSGIGRILMKFCWDIEKDVPDLILGVPGAHLGVKNLKKQQNKKTNPKN